MRQLLRKPFLLALILSLPLWIAFNNYIVAICVALLISFSLSMIDSLVAIQRQQRRPHDRAAQSTRTDASSSDSDS